MYFKAESSNRTPPPPPTPVCVFICLCAFGKTFEWSLKSKKIRYQNLIFRKKKKQETQSEFKFCLETGIQEEG